LLNNGDYQAMTSGKRLEFVCDARKSSSAKLLTTMLQVKAVITNDYRQNAAETRITCNQNLTLGGNNH
jgi:hypothetical protein